MKRHAVIKKCREQDRKSGRKYPKSKQEYCLWDKQEKEILFAGPKSGAEQHEKDVNYFKHQGSTMTRKYIRLAEVPESAIKDFYNPKWGQDIMKAIGGEEDMSPKTSQYLFKTVWNAVIQLMDKALMSMYKLDTTEYAKDPTFVQALAGLAYFVTDDGLRAALGVKSDSLQKAKGHLESLMATIGQEAPVDETLKGLKQQAAPVVKKAFDGIVKFLKEEMPDKPAPAAEGTEPAQQQMAASVRKTADTSTIYWDDIYEGYFYEHGREPRQLLTRDPVATKEELLQIVSDSFDRMADQHTRVYLRDASEGETTMFDPEAPVGYLVSITYSTVVFHDDESGDYDDENGYESEDVYYSTLEEVAQSLAYDHTWLEWSGYPPQQGDWITSEGEEDYRTGENTSYAAHIKHEGDKSALTVDEMQYLHTELRLHGDASKIFENAARARRGAANLPWNGKPAQAKKTWDTLTKGKKHKMKACIKKMTGVEDIETPAAHCKALEKAANRKSSQTKEANMKPILYKGCKYAPSRDRDSAAPAMQMTQQKYKQEKSKQQPAQQQAPAKGKKEKPAVDSKVKSFFKKLFNFPTEDKAAQKEAVWGEKVSSYGRIARTQRSARKKGCGCRDRAAAGTTTVKLPTACVEQIVGTKFSKSDTTTFTKKDDHWFVEGVDSNGIVDDTLVSTMKSYCEMMTTARKARTKRTAAPTGFYGTDYDTFYVAEDGDVWIVRSEDAGNATVIPSLPMDAEPIEVQDEELWDTAAAIDSGAIQVTGPRHYAMNRNAAALYDYETGDVLSEGLQGAMTSDEAISVALDEAVMLGAPVLLVDDDGEFVVYPDGHVDQTDTDVRDDAFDDDYGSGFVGDYGRPSYASPKRTTRRYR